MDNAIRDKPYLLKTKDDQAEITLYGEIVEARPVDPWTEKPADGPYIIQSEFLQDLNTLSQKVKTLTIRVNSVGGDAGVSLLIHNRLRELADRGISLRCIVDGMAMSGGSLIMCACDSVTVNPASLIMIHQCRAAVWGDFSASELRRRAEALEAWDGAAETVYQRKTGLSSEEIRRMMENTTYMTGQEALEKHFADTLLEDADSPRIAASADRRVLYVGNRQFRLPSGLSAPESIPIESPAVREETGGNPMEQHQKESLTPAPAAAGNASGAGNMDTRPPAENAAAGEENAAALAAAERTRLREIDEFSAFCDPETVWEAKYGENACDVKTMLLRAAKKAKAQGRTFLANLEADNRESGAEHVTAVPAIDTEPGANPDSPAAVRAAAKAAAHRYLQNTKQEVST